MQEEKLLHYQLCFVYLALLCSHLLLAPFRGSTSGEVKLGSSFDMSVPIVWVVVCWLQADGEG